MAFFVAMYKPLMAAIAVAALTGAGVEVFFPQLAVEKLVRARGRCPRLAIVFEPLFSGYLFVRRTDERARGELLRTRGIRGMVKFGDTPGIVADHVVELLRLQEKAMLVPSSRKVRPMFTQGQIINIMRGPFQDRLAVVDRMSKADRVSVLFSFFGTTTRADISVDDVQLAPALSSRAIAT